MTTFPNPEPLTDAELDRLGDFLKSRKGGKAMNLEELDGFFAALIAGPEPVMPSEYNRELFGCESPEFSDLDEAKDILGLLMRHTAPPTVQDVSLVLIPNACARPEARIWRFKSVYTYSIRTFQPNLALCSKKRRGGCFRLAD
jgi:hypothetical protein